MLKNSKGVAVKSAVLWSHGPPQIRSVGTAKVWYPATTVTLY